MLRSKLEALFGFGLAGLTGLGKQGAAADIPAYVNIGISYLEWPSHRARYIYFCGLR